MRVFQEPSWEYTVYQFEKLSHRISWIRRFRLPYYGMYVRKNDYKWKLFLKNITGAASLCLQCLLSVFNRFPKLSSRKYVILLSNNNAYVQCMLPIIKQLNEQDASYFLFTSEKEKAAVTGRLAAKQLTAENLITEKALVGGLSNLANWIQAGLFASLDSISWLLSDTRFAFWNLPQLWQFAFHQHFYKKSVTRLLSSTTQLMAANDHWLWETLFFECAQMLPCKSWVIQHALIGDFCYPMLAKQYAVWGPMDKKLMLEKFEALTEEVVELGCPYYDDFEMLCQKSFATDKRFEQNEVVFFSEPYFKYDTLGEGEYGAVVDWIMQLGLEVLPAMGKKLVLKIHPLDKASFYSAVPGKIEISQQPLLDSLKNACLAITVDSAALFEAGLANIPTLQLKRNSFKRVLDFSPTGLTKTVTSADELKVLLQTLLSDQKAYENLQNQVQQALNSFLVNRGKSVERFIQP